MNAVQAAGQNRKRRQNWNTHTRQKSVEPGMAGLFFTCDGHEKQALHEAYNLLDGLLDKEEAEPKASSSDEDEDVADSLKKICKREGEAAAKKQRRCLQRPTGVKNCLFVTVKGADVVQLCEKLVDAAQTQATCRFLQRALPVEETSTVSLKELNDVILKLVQRYLVVDAVTGALPSYALEFKARNNDQIKKQNVLEMLNDAIAMVAPAAKVDLSNPQVTFFIQVVRKTLMAGVARDFHQRRKYSMRPKEEGTKEEKKETSEVEPSTEEKSE